MKNNRAGAKANMKRSKYDMLRADTTCKFNHLEALVSADKTRTKETEACLSQQVEEICTLKAAMVQMQQQMEDQRHQWEEDKSRFLAEQAQTVIDLDADVIEAQENLERNQKLLLKMISAMAEGLEKEKEERRTSSKSLMDRIRTLEEQLGTPEKDQTNTNVPVMTYNLTDNVTSSVEVTCQSMDEAKDMTSQLPWKKDDANQQAAEIITSAGSKNTDLTEKDLTIVNFHKQGAKGKAKKKASKNVTVLTYNLDVTDSFRESVVVTCHLRDMEKLKAHRAKLALRRKKKVNNSVFPGESDFPPLQGDQPEPHTLPNEDEVKDTSIPKISYAEILATPAPKMSVVISEVPETTETNNIHSEAPDPQPEVISATPTTPSDLPVEAPNMESADENTDPTLKHLPAETGTYQQQQQPQVTPSRPEMPFELPVQSPNMESAEESAVQTAPNLPAVERITSADSKKIDVTEEDLPLMSEDEFQKTSAHQDKEISELQQENASIVSEMNTCTELKHDVINISISSTSDQLQAEKSCEKEQRKESEISLAKVQEETGKVQTALAQVQTRREIEHKEYLEEQSSLKHVIEQLKQQIKSDKTEAAKQMSLLYVELDTKDKLYADTTSKISHLEALVSAEKTRTKETETCLSQQVEETCKMKAALVQTQQQMEDHRHQWEKDKSHLLAEQAKTVNAHFIDTQKILESNQQHLLEIISTMAEGLEKEREERKTSTESLMNRIRTLEEQLEATKKDKTNTSLSGEDASSSDPIDVFKDLPTTSCHNEEGGTKTNKVQSKDVPVMTNNLSVTDNIRSSVEVTCHQQSMGKGKASKLPGKREEDFNNGPFLEEDDFPALQRDWPGLHTYPDQRGNKGTSNPQGTYAHMLSKPVWPKASSSKRRAKWT